jgi:hypothetical protein
MLVCADCYWIVASEETRLEINLRKSSKCPCLMNRMQDKSHNKKRSVNPLKCGEVSGIWVQLLTNQNYICTEIKSRLTSGNACYHSFEILLSSCLISKNINIKIEL